MYIMCTHNYVLYDITFRKLYKPAYRLGIARVYCVETVHHFVHNNFMSTRESEIGRIRETFVAHLNRLFQKPAVKCKVYDFEKT